MNIKDFFNQRFFPDKHNKKETKISEYIFSRPVFHHKFKSFEDVFDKAISKGLEVLMCDTPHLLRIGFIITNRKRLALHSMRLSAFKKAGMWDLDK